MSPSNPSEGVACSRVDIGGRKRVISETGQHLLLRLRRNHQVIGGNVQNQWAAKRFRKIIFKAYPVVADCHIGIGAASR